MRGTGGVCFVAAMALLSAGVAHAFGVPENGETVPLPHGVVQFFEGDVSIGGKPVEPGQMVHFGDRLRTGKGSFIEVVFNSRNIFRLGENSEAVIRISNTESRIDLAAGAFYGVFADLSGIGGSDRLQVHTPTAVGGVRGTTFFVKVIDPRTTAICACHGTVIMHADGREPLEVRATNHDMYQFSRTETGIEVSRPAEMHHSGAEMDLIAGKIGVRIPWGSVE